MMNPLIRHFLPSVIRGVYRYDDDLAKVHDQKSYATFVEGKLRFLPLSFKEDIERLSTFNPEFAHAHKRYFLPDDRLHTRREYSNRAKAFFKANSYFADALRGEEAIENSPKFLEIQFVKRVLAPLLSAEGLRNIVPQTLVGPYKIDFGIEGSSRFALECDGFGKFQNRSDLDGFIDRQNFITAQGWRRASAHS